MAMGFDEVRSHLLACPGAAEDFPFGPDAHVFKVPGATGKMFATLSIEADGLARVTLKCDPGLAPALRERYPAVTPGYYMNKAHWNTVVLDGSVPDDEVADWVAMSYDLVVAGLPKAVRAGLEANPT